VNRAFALTIGLLAALAPATARAQTNIDQGKSASQIFSNACVECHKAPHGLAKGKSAATVAEFLREHYTTSRDQAAALAAYVVGGRDIVAAPVPGRRPPKPEATPSGLPSFMNPIERPEPSQRENRPAIATRNRRKEPVTPEPPQEPAAVAHAPAAVVTEPAAHPETPAQEATPAAAPTPTAAAPMETPSGEPVPRDNIPD
jgi:hypothetical protein